MAYYAPQYGGYNAYGGYQYPMNPAGAVPGFTVPQYQMNPQQMMQMPMSMQANMMTMNYSWNMNNFSMRMAEQIGCQEEVEEEEEEDEEEEEIEDEDEDAKEERKQAKRRMKKNQKAAKILEEKVKDDGDLLQKFRDMYIDELWNNVQKNGILEPTEGTVKEIKTYTADDPVTVWTQEDQGFDITGESWDSEYDVQYLRNAIDGAGTNEDAIINVVTTRNNDQRQTILKMYKTACGQDLIEDLNGELSGDFRDCVQALFIRPAHFDALNVKKAIYGAGTNEEALIEIFLTRTNEQIQEMRQVYGEVVDDEETFPDDKIEQDIENDTSGDFKRLLISASQGNRNELSREDLEEAVEDILTPDGEPTGRFQVNFEKLVNVDKAQRDANALFEAGEDQIGTDEETFIRVFALRDYYQMQCVYNEYVKLCQRDILNSIDRETSGDFEKGLYTIAMNVKCRPMLFAIKLKECMEGLGTAEEDLIRIIVSRSELDMVQIKKCFLDMTHQTLYKWLQDDTSFDFCKILCKLVGKN